MKFEELWSGGPRIAQLPEVFKPGSDSMLLSAFGHGRRSKRACDLGCGGGILSLLLASQNPGLTVDAIDISSQAAGLCSVNVKENGLVDRVRVICGDLRRCREFFEAGAYDLVISNPPYFTEGGGKSAGTEAIATARDERSCTLFDLCAVASYLTRPGGRFAVVFRPERLSELLCTMSAAGIEPKRLRLVQYKAYSAPNMVLVEGHRGGRIGLSVDPTLIMANSDGSDTEEIRKIFHMK
jgi:tRNA1Val (adenine37-N6)-methyltransferase